MMKVEGKRLNYEGNTEEVGSSKSPIFWSFHGKDRDMNWKVKEPQPNLATVFDVAGSVAHMLKKSLYG